MENRFKLSIALGALIAFSLAAVQPASAGVFNGSFELAPDFTGYDVIGNYSIQEGDFKIAKDGNQQALISTNPNPIPGMHGAIGINDPSVDLDAFFNLGAGTLAGANVKGASGFKQTFTASAGNSLQFWYDFATNEFATTAGGNADFGFFTLQGPGGGPASLVTLDTPNSSLSSTDSSEGISFYFSSQTGYKLETGFQSVTLNILTDGTYTLAFGVANVGSTDASSGLVVDAITEVPTTAVPLPSTALAGVGLFASLGCMQLLRRRRVVSAI